MTSMRLVPLLILFSLMFLPGCSGLISSKYPLPATTTQDVREQFEGEWISENDVICISFDKDMVGTIISRDTEGLSSRQLMEIIVTSSDKSGYISALLIEDGKRQDEYYLARYRLVDKDIIVFWNLKGKEFEDAISKKLLQADDERSYMITSEPGQLLEFIRSNDSKELFDYRNPGVVRKISSTCSFGRDADNSK